MKTTDLIFLGIASILGAIVFVELFLFLPIINAVKSVEKNAVKSLKVVSSKRISEHWKERVLLRYALLIFEASLKCGFYLIVLVLSFVSVFFFVGMFFYGNFSNAWELILSPYVQLIALLAGLGYAFFRKKITSKRSGDYTLMSKFLHHLALDSNIIKRVAFDMDCQMAKFKKNSEKNVKPVFITGLARAGTTILLEALYSTGEFAALTYRDMPFVTAPILWKRISSGNQKQSELKERAHGDRLKVNYDSPEAFEEVFWLAFMKGSYRKEHWLEPHGLNEELRDAYRKYINNIVISTGINSKSSFYLSKNNNNLMRIHGLKETFPEGFILVPFRNPRDHALSLFKQHRRFRQMHDEDNFSLTYMNWLGHHEFGLNFKPFKFDDEALPKNGEETKDPNYWIRYWKCVYDYLIRTNPSEVIYFSYDAFCERPKKILEKLAGLLSIEASLLGEFHTEVKGITSYRNVELDQSVLRSAETVHERLLRQAL
jgi:hypothetical protein